MAIAAVDAFVPEPCAAPADSALQRIAARVAVVCPRPEAPLEVAAVLESLGYTDRLIAELTGAPDSMALGRVLFDILRAQEVTVSRIERRGRGAVTTRSDWQVLLQTFSLSSVYALPWIATFVIERWRPDLLRVAPGAAGPLALAVMFSLIVAGGFVQCIARKGTFFSGLGQPALGAEVSVRIWRVGVCVLAASAVAACALAWYLGAFEMRYAAAGALAYVLLGVLWLTCGVLWLEGRYWHVPVSFAAGGVMFVVARRGGADVLGAEIGAAAGALAAALILMAHAVYRHRRRGRGAPLPRAAVVVRALVPYFCYGCGYFAFVFADRLAAGSAVPTASGLIFSIDARYQAGMDAALLCFLISMTAVEFLSYRFVQFWHREASKWTPSRGAGYRARVRRRCLSSMAAAFAAFAVVAAIVLSIPAVREMLSDPFSARIAAVGVVAYLLLDLALFNALVLFSVNDPVSVLRGLVAALAVAGGAGYVLSNVFGSFYAVVALAAGAGILLWRLSAATRTALGRPGYGCYVA